MGSSVRRAGWWSLLVVAWLLLTGGPAMAHAVLLSAWPAAGQQLDDSPERLTLEFNESVRPLRFGLFDGAGAPRALSEVPVLPGDRFTVRPAAPLAPGPYLLSYRVTSDDGHPVAGAFLFQIGASAVAGDVLARLQVAAVEDAWRGSVLVARWLLYLALVFGAGGALGLILLRPPPFVAVPARRAALIGSGTALCLLLPYHLLVAAELLGAGAAELLGARTWNLVVTGPRAANLALTASGLAILLAGLTRRRPLPPSWTAAGALAVAAAFTFAGHTASVEPRWLGRGMLFLHVTGAAFWLGSLPLLLLAVRRLSARDAATILKRFGVLAAGAVGAVLACGVLMTWIQMDGDLTALWTTAYGQRLAWKLAAVLALLAVAVVNRWVLTPALGGKPGRAARPLARLLAVDLALAALIVGATARLNLDPPPRLANLHRTHVTGPLEAGLDTRLAPARTGQAAATGVQVSAETLAVRFAPSATGTTSVVLDYLDGEGRVVPALEAELRLSLPEKGVEELRWRAKPDATGRLRAEGVTVPFAGRWTVAADLFVDDFTRRAFQGEARFEPGAAGHAGHASMADLPTGGEGGAATGGEHAGGHAMVSDLDGAVMNENADRLPIDCPVLGGDAAFTVRAGKRYASPGLMFGFDRYQWAVPACTRVSVTFVNEDDVRHQFMLHGLPRYLYPQGMIHLEADGGTSRRATFIVPATPRTHLVHCDMAQHTEKGLKGQLKVAGGSGDLPGIPGITAPRRAEAAPLRWTPAQRTTVVLGLVVAAAVLALGLVPAFPRRISKALSGRGRATVMFLRTCYRQWNHASLQGPGAQEHRHGAESLGATLRSEDAERASAGVTGRRGRTSNQAAGAKRPVDQPA